MTLDVEGVVNCGVGGEKQAGGDEGEAHGF